MERLTEWRGEHAAIVNHHENYIDRLAAYEDTGLEPEEVKAFVSTADNIVKLDVNKLYPDAEITMYGKPLSHWQELSKAEQDGRLVVLPCKVGDTVYVLNASKFHKGEVYEGYVSSFHYSFHGLEMLGTGFYGRVDDLLNKKVFFTREEAEKALEGVSEDA